MKKLNSLLLLFIAFTLSSCLKEIERVDPPNEVPKVSFDVATAIALQSGSDITNLVTFNGEPAGTFTTELTVDSKLTVGRPEGLAETDELEYTYITLFNSDGEEVEVNPDTQTTIDGNLKFVVPDGKSLDYYVNAEKIDVFEIQAINADANVDLDYKYDLEVYITRDGTRYGPYIIDPKIKIRSLN